LVIAEFPYSDTSGVAIAAVLTCLNLWRLRMARG
jgi:hypothetical protein